MKYKKAFSLFLVLVILLVNVTPVLAGTFNRTRFMELKYGWGTTSLEEFDSYDQAFPGYFPIAEITFETDGTFTAFDTATGNSGWGTYDKQRRQLEITIVAPSYGYVVQYVGEKVARRTFAGEILIDGVVTGHWRGTF